MTARELARAVRTDSASARESDAWISGVLRGTQGLSWKYFDATCEKLRLSPAELVREDEDVVRELAPDEMALLRYYHEWPPVVQRRWLELLGHFTKTMPDPDMAALIDRVRAHPPSLRRPVMAWLTRLLEEGIPPEAIAAGTAAERGDEGETIAAMRRVERLKTLRAARRPVAGQKNAAADS